MYNSNNNANNDQGEKLRILHLQNWRFLDIIPVIPYAVNAGYDAILISMLQPYKECRSDLWWLSYQAGGIRVSFEGNPYGTKEEFELLIKEINKYNMKLFTDNIYTHTASDDYNCLEPHQCVDSILRNDPNMWREKKMITNWNDRDDVIHHCMGLPGLNHYNKKLQKIVIEFQNNLIDLGINGFRYDAAKSIPLPEENCDFWPTITEGLKEKGIILFGEVLNCGQDLYDKYGRYFKILTNDFPNNPYNSVAFVESHDTYLGFKTTCNIPANEIATLYKNLALQKPNTLFYARPFDETWKSNEVSEGNHKKFILK